MRILEKDDFLVSPCLNQENAYHQFIGSAFRFVVLSVEDKGHQSSSIIQQIREKDKNCIIVLIINLPAIEIGDTLKLGVDSFVYQNQINDLGIRLLLLKRRYSQTNTDQVFHHKDFSFHEDLSLLRCKNKEIHLSKTEKLILYELFNRNGFIEARRLIRSIWNDEMIFDTDRLRTRIFNLRKKIRLISDTSLVKSVKGSGYMLA